MSSTVKITALIKTTCVIVAITLLLFIAINAGAQLYLEQHPLSVTDMRYFLDEESSEGIAIRKRIFNTNDERLLKAYPAYCMSNADEAVFGIDFGFMLPR